MVLKGKRTNVGLVEVLEERSGFAIYVIGL